MSQPSPLTARAVEILEDGEWHDLESVLVEIGKLVPPGKAVRELERRRRNAARRKKLPGAEQRAVPLDHHQQVRAGKRLLAMQVFQGNRATFEIDPPASGGGKRRLLNRRVRLLRVPQSVARIREAAQ